MDDVLKFLKIAVILGSSLDDERCMCAHSKQSSGFARIMERETRVLETNRHDAFLIMIVHNVWTSFSNRGHKRQRLNYIKGTHVRGFELGVE